MAFKKGNKPWNIGKKGSTNSGSFKKGHLGFKGNLGNKRPHTKEEIEKIRVSSVGRKRSQESIQKTNLFNTGKKRTEETREKIRLALTGKPRFDKRGENSNFWRGGTTGLRDKIENTIEYRLWREAVFARDNYTCQKNFVRGGRLEAHHIHNFADFPELRTSIENGITLSEQAHKEFHRKYGHKNNTLQQLLEFLSK